jgi:ribosomal protein S18 acetylase RimI-like enzyme
MGSSPSIRNATTNDEAAVRAIAIGTGLFDAESWPDVASVMQDSTSGLLPDHNWIVFETNEEVVGAAYYAPEPFAHQMWNMYFLGVLPGHQGDGAGAALVSHIENVLRSIDARVLIIETSGVDSFAPTREFYLKQGYDEEARIREFYGPGDDKIVFWKALYSIA